MSDWQTVRLGTLLTDIQSGFASGIHNSGGEGVPHLRPMNVSVEGRIDRTVLKYVAADLADRPERRLEPGDVVFNNTNSPELVGKTAVFYGDDKPAFSNHMTRLRTDSSKLDPGYLALRLHFAWMRGFFAEHCNNHVSQASVGRGVLQDFAIELPPLPVQVAIRQALEEMRARQATASTHLIAARRVIDRFRQAVLAAAWSGRLTADWRDAREVIMPAGDPIEAARQKRKDQLGRRFHEPELNLHVDSSELPSAWHVAPLGLLLEDLQYGTSKRSEYGFDGVPVLRIPNVSSGYLSVSDLKFARLDKREAESLALESDDLLMIRSNGSVQLLGRTVLVNDAARGMAYAGYLMRLRVDRAVAKPEFVAMAFSAPQMRQQIEMPVRSTSGVHNINSDEVRGLVIPLPSMQEQIAIMRRAGQLLELAASIERRVLSAMHDVERSSQAVLAKAFRGELVVTTSG